MSRRPPMGGAALALAILLAIALAWQLTSERPPTSAPGPPTEAQADAAEEPASTAFHMGRTQRKELQAGEARWRFVERRYDPPIEFQPVERSEARFDAPELAQHAVLSTVAKGDMEWKAEVFDSESWRYMTERWAADSTPEAERLELQRLIYREHRVRYTRRVDFTESGSDYVIIFQEMIPKGGEGAIDELPTVFKKDGDRWLATQQLAGHPVLMYDEGARREKYKVREIMP